MIKGEGNRRRKCKECEVKIPACDGLVVGVNFVCSRDCAFKLANKALSKSRDRQKQKAKREHKEKKKEATARHRERKKQVMRRSDWYSKLQKLVNQLVRIRDIGKPCPTCGRNGEDIAWDAGHFIPQKGSDPRRFMMKNNHRQCVYCNQYGSGRRAEYRIWMIEKYGLEFVEWLECDSNHKSLKEQFPHWSDIENAIAKARKEIRELGFNPSI